MSGHQLAMQLRMAYLAMHRRTNAVFASAGVTADQFVVLAALSEEDALTQRELVDRTSSDANSLRAMLVLLEKEGLVERQAHPSDGRARSVKLTSKGTRVFQKLWQQSESLRSELLGSFSRSESAVLLKLLHRLTDAMRSASDLASGRRRVGSTTKVE